MNTIVIFDFDCTVIDVDSDNWVAEELGVTPLFDSLRAQMPWNDMMDALMEAVHKQGKSISDIERSLHSVPLQPEKISAIKAAHALGCELRILSDANAFFIKTILDKYEVSHLFTQIHTNPAYVDNCGRLHIGPFHPKSETPHGCELCPPNMCKGRVIDEIRAMNPPEANRIIYAGDGRGDYCPSLMLSVGDCILPREGYPLRELLNENMGKVKASVYPWNTAKEMEDVLLQLIHAQQMEQTSEQEYGFCGTCATCGMPKKLNQVCEVVSQIV